MLFRSLLQNSLALARQAGQQLDIAFALDKLALLLVIAFGEVGEAKHCLQESLSLYQTGDDLYGLANALRNLGAAHSRAAEYTEAERVLQESLALSKAIGDLRGMALTLNTLGVVVSDQGWHAAAQNCWRECLALYQELNDQKGMADALNNLGNEAVLMQEWQAALPLLEQSLSIVRLIGYRLGIASSLDSLGYAACGLGDYPAARRHFSEALRIMMDIHAVAYAVETLVGLATVQMREGQFRPALDLLTFVLQHPKAVPEVRDRAAKLLAELEAYVLPQEIASAREQASQQARELEGVAEALLR